MEILAAIDHALFQLINSGMSNRFFDFIMPIATDLHKVPIFYLTVVPFFIFRWFRNQRLKALPVFIALIVTIGLADLITYRVLKPHFKRDRPPVYAEMTDTPINIRVNRYAGYSFPSNHAANNFAGATLLSLAYPAMGGTFYAFAALVAFSRVYVGVHYPGDVMAGALLGFLIGFIVWKLLYLVIKSLPEKFHIRAMTTRNRYN